MKGKLEEIEVSEIMDLELTIKKGFTWYTITVKEFADIIGKHIADNLKVSHPDNRFVVDHNIKMEEL